MVTHPPKRQSPGPNSPVIRWLLDSDPAIRWQVLQDLAGAFAHDLAAGALQAGRAALSASSTRGPQYSPQRLVDGAPGTCWAASGQAAADGQTAAEIRLEFGRPVTFNLFQAQEAIAYSQRVRGWQLEAQAPGGGWAPLASGTTLGPKRLARFAPLTARQVRLRLETASAPPALTCLGLFHSLKILPGENHRS